MYQVSPEVQIRVYGPMACFTRPEMKVERLSYEVMTPSAARGIFESIMWKPGMRYYPTAIEIYSPIDHISIKRNEVTRGMELPSKAVMAGTEMAKQFLADDRRAQRNMQALRDVDYVIRAVFALTDKAGPRDNIPKFLDMLSRRIEHGQCHSQPYMGCREFAAFFEPPDPSRKPLYDLNKELGWMLHDINFDDGGNSIRLFNARIEHGVVRVPQSVDTVAVKWVGGQS